MKTDKNPNAALPWVIVFASAAMTLASSTQRPPRAPSRTLPVRVKQADPAAAPVSRAMWVRA